MARLPQPGSDENVWGDILNQFLDVAHNSDGTIKAGAVSKSAVGLGNADNTSDANKPVSNATQTALDARIVWVDAADSNTARPAGAIRVFWLGGTIEPVNMQTGDVWFKED